MQVSIDCQTYSIIFQKGFKYPKLSLKKSFTWCFPQQSASATPTNLLKQFKALV